MGVTVGELEVIFQANTDQVVDAVNKVEGKIGGLKSKMDGMGKSGGALSTAAGNLIAGVVRGVVNMGGELISSAVEVSSYNERMKLSFGNVFDEQVKAANSITKYRQEGFKTITVTNGVAQLSSKVQKQLTKDIDKSAEAQSNLLSKTTQLQQAQYNLANKGPKKNEDPAAFALRQQAWQGQINKYTKDVTDMEGVISKGAAANGQLTASQNAVSTSYRKTVPNMIAYQEVQLSAAEIAAKTQKMVDDAILSAENMAVHSPFNKEDVINTMSDLVGISNMSLDQAKKEAQGLVDLAAARGRDGKQLQNFSKLYATAAATTRVYWKDIKGTVDVIPDFMQKLADSMGVPISSLQKLSRAGKISFDDYNKVVQEAMEKSKGKASEFSETLPGLIESIGDVKKNILQDFFAPILDGAKPALAAIVDVFTDPAMRNSFKDMGKTLGKGLTDGINTAGKVITSTLKKLGLVGNDNPLVKRFLGDDKGLSKGTLDWVDSLSTKFANFVSFLRTHGETIKQIFISIGTAIGALAGIGAFMNTVKTVGTIIAGLATPIGIISLAIAAAVLAWNTNFGGFRDMVTGVWNNIKGPLEKLWGAIQGIGDAMSKGVGFKDAFTGALSGIVKPEILSQFDPLLKIPETIKKGFEGKISIGDMFTGVVAGVAGVVAAISKEMASEGTLSSLVLGASSWGAKIVSGITAPDKETKASLESIKTSITTIAESLAGEAGTILGSWSLEIIKFFYNVKKDDIQKGVNNFVDSIIDVVVNGEDAGARIGAAFTSKFVLAVTKNPNWAIAAQVQELGTAQINNLERQGKIDLSKAIEMAKQLDIAVQHARETGEVPDSIDLVFDIKPKPTVLPADPPIDTGGVLKAAIGDSITPDRPLTPTIGISPTIEIKKTNITGTLPSNIPGLPANMNLFPDSSKPVGSAPVILPTTQITQPIQTGVVITSTPGITGTNGTTTTIQTVTNDILKAQGIVPATGQALPIGVAAPGQAYQAQNPINVNVPINIIPTYTSTAGTAQTPVDFVGTWAMTQGWTKEGGPNSYAAKAGIDFHIPVNIKPSAGSADAVTGSASGNAGGAGTAVGGMASLIDKWTQSMGWTKEGTGYTAPIPITLHLPVIIDASLDTSAVNGSGETGGSGGGGAKSLGIADSIIKSLVDTFNGGAAGGPIFPIAAALGNMVKGAVNIAKINLGLNPISAEAPSYAIGKLIADSIGQALGDSLEVVTTKLDTIGTKLEDLRTKQVDPTAAAITSMANATLIGFVGPKLDEFRNSYLIPLNNEFARLNSLLSSILTQLGLLGGAAAAAANVNVPNVGGAGAPGGLPPGGSNTNSNLPSGKDKNPNQTVSFTVPVHIGDEKVSEKVYTYTKGKLVEEMNRYG